MAPAAVVFKRKSTAGRIVIGVVERKRVEADGGVEAASSVACERTMTVRRVLVASSVALKRKSTGGGVSAAGGVAKER